MELQAQLLKILPAQTGQGKNGTWKKQEYVFQTQDQYPKQVCIAVWGDKVSESSMIPGSTYAISFDIESREYNGRYFTEAKAWKIVPAGGASATPAPSSNPTPPPFDAPMSSEPVMEASDDLPF
ncbi:MAG: DUF3127 domain-containing protein [Bacteroidales bacterium]|jgi:hypothetical protein|nr:DUF3127 domain-containing protein [Bacteroidales bacterium]